MRIECRATGRVHTQSTHGIVRDHMSGIEKMQVQRKKPNWCLCEAVILNAIRSVHAVFMLHASEDASEDARLHESESRDAFLTRMNKAMSCTTKAI